MEERSNSSYSTKSTEAKQLAGKGIEQNLPPKRTRRPLSLLLSPSSMFIFQSYPIPERKGFKTQIRKDPTISKIRVCLYRTALNSSQGCQNRLGLTPRCPRIVIIFVQFFAEPFFLVKRISNSSQGLTPRCPRIVIIFASEANRFLAPRPPSHLPHSGTCQILQMHGEIKLLFKYIFLFLFRIGSIPSKFVMPQIKSF